MRNSQRGMTFLGLMILVAFVGLFVYAGIRLVPVYLEYLNISKILDNLKTETEGGVSQQAIRTSLERRFEIDDIKSLDWKDVEISKEGSSWTVHAAYDAPAPFIANVSFLVHFDKSVTLGASAGP